MDVAIWAAALVVSVAGGWGFAKGVLALAQRTSRREGSKAHPSVPDAVPPAGPSPDAVPPAGPGGAPRPHQQPAFDIEAAPHSEPVAASEPGAAGEPGGNGRPRPRTSSGKPPDAVLRGGTWIGILERLAVTGCILVGYPSGVAVVVAVKALGRFPELKDNPAASERFIIGSLASLIWAAAAGAAAAALLG